MAGGRTRRYLRHVPGGPAASGSAGLQACLAAAGAAVKGCAYRCNAFQRS
jgi:hypothetical protein